MEPEEDSSEVNSMWNATSEDISDEQKLLRERRFLVCESALLDLIKRSTCAECGQAVDPDSVVAGEKISSGIKYKFVCNKQNQLNISIIALICGIRQRSWQ